MRRATSVRPEPTRPPSPTTSPAFTEKLTSRTRRPAERFSTRSTSRPPEARTRSANIDFSVRPTIMRMSPATSTSAGVTTPATCPSFITVMRSAMRKTSSSRCEM